MVALFTFSFNHFPPTLQELLLLFFPSYFYNHANRLTHIFVPQTCTEVLLCIRHELYWGIHSRATQNVAHGLVLVCEFICYQSVTR